MSMNKKDYPENWGLLQYKILSRAQDRCELCGAPNKTWILRDRKCSAIWMVANEIIATGAVKIVLTIHHIDRDIKNNSKENLIALCQRCHLRLDLERHLVNRSKKKRRNAMQEVPQQETKSILREVKDEFSR